MTDRPGDEAGLRHVRGAGKLASAEGEPLRCAQAAEGNGQTSAGSRRFTRWTRRRKDDFLTVLAATSNVSEAARAVRMRRSSAYLLKAKDVEFAAAWTVALERGYSELEMHLVRQVRDGTLRTEKIYDCEKGEITHIKLIHSFPLAVGMNLLTAHRAQVDAHRRAMSGDDGSYDARGQVEQELDRIRERLLEPANLIGEDGADD